MKKITSFFALILLCSSAFAQDSYYVRAGLGAGLSSSSFQVAPGFKKSNHESIASGQSQLNFGYEFGKWQIETGVGYLLTGLSFVNSPGGGGCVVGPNPNNTLVAVPASGEAKYTITNPHLVVPLVASYKIHGCSKMSVSPGIGVEALYNFKGKMTTSNQAEAAATTMDYTYNNLSAAVVLKLDIQYKVCKYFSVWCSPSYQNMVTSLTKKVPGDGMSRIYDRALLVNAGVQYNLHCCHKQAGAKS